MTLKALVNLIENNKNFTVDQKWVYQNSRKKKKITARIFYLLQESFHLSGDTVYNTYVHLENIIHFFLPMQCL
jgi:hypothetical protein